MFGRAPLAVRPVAALTTAATTPGGFTPALLTSSSRSNVSLSNDLLTATALSGTTTSAIAGVRCQQSQCTGQFYFEVTFLQATNSFTVAGIAAPAAVYQNFGTSELLGLGVYASGGSFGVYYNGVSKGMNLGAYAAGAVIGYAIDLINMRAWMRLGASGNWNASASNTPATPSTGIDISSVFKNPLVPAWPMFALAAVGDQFRANFGATAFVGAVPSGFTAGWPMQTTPTVAVATAAGAVLWGQSTTPQVRLSSAGAVAWVTNPAPPVRLTAAGAIVWVDISTPWAGGISKAQPTVSIVS